MVEGHGHFALSSIYQMANVVTKEMLFRTTPIHRAQGVEKVSATPGLTRLLRTDPNRLMANATPKANATSPPANHCDSSVE
jgi:hypothetical protein